MINRGIYKVVDYIFYMIRRVFVGVGWVVCVGVFYGGLYCFCICFLDF